MSTDRVRLWSVRVFNDDYTPMCFVVKALLRTFDLTLFQATESMVAIHASDSISIGTFTREIAKTKAAQIIDLADAAGVPLYADIEPKI